MSIVSRLTREMSLWKPQFEGLKAFDDIVRKVSIGKDVPKASTIRDLMSVPSFMSRLGQDAKHQRSLFGTRAKSEFDFNLEAQTEGTTAFPSFCFKIATGGGKTRLMGACIAYLYYTKGFKNFFILSKGETIYNKHRLDDFHSSSPKHVFKGLTEFPVPRLIDGDNYDRSAYAELFTDDLVLYLFNIEKIFNERTDVEFRFHRFKETLGGSFADILRAKQDLVFLMDESHNVRAEKSLKAINALNPILGLEFTATPKAANVIYSYSLREAIERGLVKRPVVIARRDDDSLIEEKEDIKLSDGLRRHERKKSALEVYCRNNALPVFRPRVLISTRDIAHCKRVKEKLEQDDFLGGKYKGRVLAVHSGSANQQIEQLLNLEKIANPFEIVVHVNKLKEGWDVKSIYTIIPLRASVSEILTEQTLGRGLRLPFGKRVSRDPALSDEERKELEDVDTLEIISHEKYSAVLAKANKILDAAGVAVDDGQKLEPIQIAPDGDEQFDLSIPKIRAVFRCDEDIDLADVKVSYERFEDLDVKLVGTDLATLKERDYEHILEECKGSLVNFFVRILIEETDEFDIRDKARLQRFVQGYIDKARVAGGDKDSILFKNRGTVAADMLTQIREKISEKSTIEYLVSDKVIRFGPHWRNMPEGYTDKHKDTVLENELTHNIVAGYTKSIFTRNVFEAKQEKWLADILDSASEHDVVRWVRPPTGHMPIEYEGGRYNPDFVVELKDNTFLVLEVKAANQLQNQEVQAKARAAVAWCQAMTNATGRLWEYKLIPHDAIKPTASLRGVISKAIATGEAK